MDKKVATVFYLDWSAYHGIQMDIQYGLNGFKECEPTKEQFEKYYKQIVKIDVPKESNESRVLEGIYRDMNIGTLAVNNKVRSMCVGDIIRVGRKYYICASLGFNQIKID